MAWRGDKPACLTGRLAMRCRSVRPKPQSAVKYPEAELIAERRAGRSGESAISPSPGSGSTAYSVTDVEFVAALQKAPIG